mmetsp:Transcript_1711/g.3942  ORF Transcript_1711/g.3942 Transcript_1711/m.3942 type:complete len:86 (-) Transcript_1711:1918-2175(-)
MLIWKEECHHWEVDRVSSYDACVLNYYAQKLNMYYVKSMNQNNYRDRRNELVQVLDHLVDFSRRCFSAGVKETPSLSAPVPPDLH